MMNAETGQWLGLEDHIDQSINKILTTLQGTRLMRRSFGSVLPVMIDQSPTPHNLAVLRGAVVTAIARWERRFKIKQVIFEVSPAVIQIALHGLVNDRPVQYHHRFNLNGGE